MQKLVDSSERRRDCFATRQYLIFSPEQHRHGHKSVALGLNLQDISRTLTDDETHIVAALSPPGAGVRRHDTRQ